MAPFRSFFDSFLLSSVRNLTVSIASSSSPKLLTVISLSEFFLLFLASLSILPAMSSLSSVSAFACRRFSLT